MKTIITCFLLLLPLLVAAQTSPADGTLTKVDRDKAIKLLLDSQKETMKAISKLSDAQWNYKPAPEKWSVGLVAEHIWLGEGLLFSQVERAMKAPVNPNWMEQTKGKDELVARILLDRTGKAQAPEAIRPTGKTRAEVMAGLKESRAKTLKFAKEVKGPIKSHTADHSFKIFGTLNAYQWLIYVPYHNLRHNQQIMEVINSPGFPKK